MIECDKRGGDFCAMRLGEITIGTMESIVKTILDKYHKIVTPTKHWFLP